MARLPASWQRTRVAGPVLGCRCRLSASGNFGGSSTLRDLNWWICAGLTLLASGDETGYTALCQEMIERVSDPGQGGWSLRLLTSGPSALAGGKPPVDRFLDRVFTDPVRRSTGTGALLLMRSGRFLEEGLRELERVFHDIKYSWTGFGSSDEDFDRSDLPAFLAIAHHRLGHPREAQTYLAQARSRLGQLKVERDGWARALATKLVTREAESLIQQVNDNLPTDPFAH